MRPSRIGLTVAGVVAGLVLVGVARIDDLKKWFVSQWDTPHGLLGWLFALPMPGLMDEIYAPFADLAHLDANDDLLDVACGAGGFLAGYAQDVRRVAGLDRSDMQLKLAHQRLRERLDAGTAEMVKGDAATLPWEDESFSIVTCLLGLEFFTDPGAALHEMERVLRPGGRMVVTFGIDEDHEACVRECDWFGIDHLPEAEVRKMVEDAGFAVVDITYPDLEYHARFIQGMKSA